MATYPWDFGIHCQEDKNRKYRTIEESQIVAWMVVVQNVKLCVSCHYTFVPFKTQGYLNDCGWKCMLSEHTGNQWEDQQGQK